jgi:peptidoglycan/LPS O-acetylase OafA/YrhL
MYFLWNSWEIWVYILGAIVAQISLIIDEHEQDKKMTLTPQTLPPSPPHSPSLQTEHTTHQLHTQWSHYYRTKLTNLPRPRTSRLLRTFGFLVAFYLLSYPIDGTKDYAPGYMTLNKLIPEWMDRKDKFYPNIGTAILIFLLARSDPSVSTWRRILNSDLAQYLGKISFGLYLTHGPVLHAFGYMIPHKIWWSMGIEGIDASNLPWVTAVLAGWAMSLVTCLWVADVWNREVENRCVKLVKKLEEACFAKMK